MRFSNAEDVTKAIGSVDGAILEGRALIVKLDHADQRGPQKRAQQSAPYFDTQLDDPLSDDGLYDEADFMDMIDAVSPKDEMEFSASSDSEASDFDPNAYESSSDFASDWESDSDASDDSDSAHSADPSSASSSDDSSSDGTDSDVTGSSGSGSSAADSEADRK